MDKHNNEMSTEEFDKIWRDLYSHVDVNSLAYEYEGSIRTTMTNYLENESVRAVKQEMPNKLAEIGQDYLLKGLPSGTIMAINEKVAAEVFLKKGESNDE